MHHATPGLARTLQRELRLLNWIFGILRSPKDVQRLHMEQVQPQSHPLTHLAIVNFLMLSQTPRVSNKYCPIFAERRSFAQSNVGLLLYVATKTR